ncbi:hypothetical protein HELRODRAFT_171308 [Helobdella robusta]|uniref:Uncharacterized protein n=1 Tax=Helobdella robusta TaxID=6412 RepID=T1F429_HELRO|nr:hypothetical protein HELRODRAFT_171308 [Helobdella robusta]ESO05650.1 hypothetical protein HELRODRAFT_171308 [Helobdella robusta]
MGCDVLTFPHTLAERYINYTALEQGSAAVKATDFKNTKYKDLNGNTRVFVPICVETFGPVDKQTQLFFDNICTKIVEKSDDPNDKVYIKHPDGCTLIPWRAGRCLAWDVTVPGTLAERYVNPTSKECGLAAARAADEKMKKYGNALPSMEFLPICIEVLGPMDPNTLKFLKAICKMISVRSGDSRELFFATNHISCLLLKC